MSERRVRHQYPKWLAWPLEGIALLLVVPITFRYIRVLLQVLFQQWPQALDALQAVPSIEGIALGLAGSIPEGPVPWEELLPGLLRLHITMAVLFFLAALVRNFLPQVRVDEEGLQVRRGFGWATIPWDDIFLVHSMNLPGERLVLLVQGRGLGLGPWFRVYSLLWGRAGLAKGVVITWHISDFDILARDLVANLQEVYGDQDIITVVDDMAYSLTYALIFLPRVTWGSLFAERRSPSDAYAHPRWLSTSCRVLIIFLLVFASWRYLGVWWRFVASRFPVMAKVNDWPVLGFFLRSFGQPDPLLSTDPTRIRQAGVALVMAQFSMVLVIVGAVFLANLFPNWLLGREAFSVRFRKRWLSIPWSAIQSVRETNFPRGGGVILLQVDRGYLTPWHTLYSLLYGAGLRRGVLFTSLLPGFDELRERVEVAAKRRQEEEAGMHRPPVLMPNARAEQFAVLRDPVLALYRAGEYEEPEEPKDEGLIKKALVYRPVPSDLPWETGPGEEEMAPELEEARTERAKQRATIRAVLTVALFPVLLILAENLLFLDLSRPLARIALSPTHRALSPILPAILMAFFTVLEWPFGAGLLSTIADMHDQEERFRRVLTWYPLALLPKTLLAGAILLVGVSGFIQPLFLFWWGLGFVWSSVILWLICRDLYGWETVGITITLAAHALFQSLMMLVYLISR